MGDPELTRDPERLADAGRRYVELKAIVEVADELDARTEDLAAAKELLTDAPAAEREAMRSEATEAEADIERLEGELRLLMLPKDPNDDKNVIVEIRGAEGGEEANLWARDLFEMYRSFAANQGWKFETLNTDPSDMGGYNEVTFKVSGDGVWSRMKHEGGPHRVQRVPATESQGRIHTSSAAVSVLPEADEVDVSINDADLQIDVYRSSGPGWAVGQHHRFGRAHHPPADRAGGVDAGREESAPEPRPGAGGPAQSAAEGRAGPFGGRAVRVGP